MAMSCIDSDLDALFSSSDFGEADGALRNGVGDPIAGIFDDEDVDTVNGEGVSVIVAQTMFTCASSKVSDPTEGEFFTLRGIDYILRYWKDDGTGTIELYFERPDP